MMLEMISVTELLNEYGIEMDELSICDMNTMDFRLMRAQMKADFVYCAEEGPSICNPEFDVKCLKVCEKARRENVHVLIFPEYAISFNVLRTIAEKQEYQPGRGALWCLPCQGMPFHEFQEKLNELEASGTVVIKDGIQESGGLCYQKNFVNTLIYCFRGKKDGKNCLVFLPQLKLCHMRDESYLCEAMGMTMGKWIYYFGEKGRSNIVCSLICADVFHSEISWDFIQQELWGKIIILHPQLNHSPKHEDFRRIRREMMAGSNKSLYITCNWAKGTTLNGAQRSQIYLPWSGIYYKHSYESEFHTWAKHIADIMGKNDEISLYGSYFPKQKTELWYSGVEEMVQVIVVRKPESFSKGSVTGKYAVNGVKRFVFENNQMKEERLKFSFRDFISEVDKEYFEYIDKIEKQEPYAFPIKCTSRLEAEGFFDMLMAKNDYSCYTLESDEASYSHFSQINTDKIDYVQQSLSQYIALVEILESNKLPEHLIGWFGERARFTYKNGERVAYNYSDDENKRTILFARTNTKREAQQFAEFIQRKLFGEDEEISELPFKVCVFYQKINLREEDYFPKANKKITDPDRMDMIQSICRG